MQNFFEEEWRSVGIFKGVDYTGYYEVSNYGNMKSLNKGNLKEKALKPYKMGKYLGVTLYKDRIRHRVKVHQVEMNAFCPNPDPKTYTQINHKDENKFNNNLNNLEWCTAQENNIWGTKIKRRKETMEKKFIPIVQLSLDGEIINVYNSKADMDGKNISSHYIISRINSGRNVSKNYFWIRLDVYNNLSYTELIKMINMKYKELRNRVDNGSGKRPVVQLTMNDNFVKQYESITEAAKEMNCSKVRIWNCVSNKTRTSCGYKWTYLDNYQNN